MRELLWKGECQAGVRRGRVQADEAVMAGGRPWVVDSTGGEMRIGRGSGVVDRRWTREREGRVAGEGWASGVSGCSDGDCRRSDGAATRKATASGSSRVRRAEETQSSGGRGALHSDDDARRD